MVVCYHMHECPVRFNEGACRSRFENDHCPHSQLERIDDAEEMPRELPSEGAGSTSARD